MFCHDSLLNCEKKFKRVTYFYRIAENSPSSNEKTTPLSSEPAAPRQPVPQRDQYRTFTARLKTFEGVIWSEQLRTTPKKLAEAGFYYVAPGNKVKCAYCGGKLLNWKKKDSAIKRHIEKFPECTFATKLRSNRKLRMVFKKMGYSDANIREAERRAKQKSECKCHYSFVTC